MRLTKIKCHTAYNGPGGTRPTSGKVSNAGLPVAATVFTGGEGMRRIDTNTPRNNTAVTHKSSNLLEINMLVA